MIVAFYEGDRLLKADIRQTAQSIAGSHNIEIVSDTDKISVMLWQDTDSTKPLCEAVTLTYNT